ncbi:hypothetical protein [Actinomadura macrotermitis]|uniref:SWIM-type domain-containing protein n=1 Tax=Actinomadura macrotermitis TaxID=2585200 RepID=A0A7K0C795_9ACTN|nr:hypothetical protein [Actinomadura macrotermitis]MQY09337.1 hypothetical protein [Actinomadura macrotermitis]
MTRADLLALTPDGLAALANRGLVKRAAKELDAGNIPDLACDGDGTVHAGFGDGARATLPAGAGLEAATCTCGAAGVCRHRIGAVLAYQRQEPAAAEPEPVPDWSPGAFDDDALAAVVGARALTAARRTLRTGYGARVRRPTAADPAASVELAACTVRFLVPGELGYVHTDAGTTGRGEAVVLAVWAFRAADERGLTGPEVTLDVGGGPVAGGDGLTSALDLVDRLLLDGAVHSGPALTAALRTAEKELTAHGLHWPAAALADLTEQLTAYTGRAAHHDPGTVAELIAELHARSRAAQHDAGSPRSAVLGTAEAGETPLRRVRLTALGCRVTGGPGLRTARVLLADAATGVVLVLRRDWRLGEDEAPAGHELAGRRVSGATLRALATGNVVSESASRSARRAVRLAAGRIAKTTVTPVGASWERLPGPVLVHDLRALEESLAALPPRPVRPRVDAELVRVVPAAEVHGVRYDPGGQLLTARIGDGRGGTAVVSARHDPLAPGALDLLADALRAGPRLVSGTVRRSRGTVLVDPCAVLTGGGVQVLDLAPGDGSAALDGGAPEIPDPITAALDTALEVCADAAHRGLRHVPAGFAARVERAAAGLAAIGLTAAAGTLRAFGTALTGDDDADLVRRWADAWIRLAATAELR